MKKLLLKFRFTFILLLSVTALKAQTPKDTIANDSIGSLPYDFSAYQKGSLYLNDFEHYDVVYDVEKNQYMLVTKVGTYEISYPILMTPEEYADYRLRRDMHDYYKGKLNASSKKKNNKEDQKNLLPKYYINSNFFESVFGGNEIEVNMQGNIELKMGFLYQEVDDPNRSQSNQNPLLFDFDQNIGASIMANVGKRLKVSANYDTKSTFDFQDIVKLEFDPSIGYDDDGIIRKIEVGNVSMPMRSSLITGAQNLFGFKTELQFGKTTISTVYAKQQSQSKTVRAEGGAIIEEFELEATDYDADRHFFLAQYFKDNFDNSLLPYPLINASIQITSIEVWATNANNTTNNVRSIVALADLGESNTMEGNIGNPEISVTTPLPNFIPDNRVNELKSLMVENGDIRSIDLVGQAFNSIAPAGSFSQGTDYSVLQNARRLMEGSDFTLNRQLGYISLNRRLADSEVLAVAYEYTINGSSEVYKVGELSSDGIIAPDNLVVKLLRGELVKTNIPMWELMMKNFYNLQAYQLNEEGFRLELFYENDATGVPINTLQGAVTSGVSSRTLLDLFYIDHLDQNEQIVEGGDGYFDFVQGITIYPDKGYMMFPKVEPFGKYLETILTDSNDAGYIFNELYEYTQEEVKNTYQSKDKYKIKGYYKTDSASGIALGAFNVPQGSVRVSSGGRLLTEGVDYVVDYQIGRVKIINPSIEASNAPISVSVEQNAIFSQDRKSFFGVDVEHKFSDNFVGGASYLFLNERPFTNKVNFGQEPIRNSVFGLNASYDTESKMLTRLANKLPFQKTDAVSNFSIRGDVAYLLPGTPSIIDLNGEAASYIDDFEGTQTPMQVRSKQLWFLASTPDDPELNLGGNLTGLAYGMKRARLAWFNIDRDLYGSQKPPNIDNNELSRAEVRQVSNEELFPNEELDYTHSNSIRTLNLAYFPNERGSYNYDVNNVDENGLFTDPENRWAGITRPLTITDFDNSNIEYIQFWMMDPYENYSITHEEGLPDGIDPTLDINQVGDLYLHLGNVSEDVLKDGRKTFENGLPEDGGTSYTNPSIWGKVPTNQSLLNAFDNDDNHRLAQDIGLDGLSDAQELNFDFNGDGTYANMQAFINALPAGARAAVQADPASDNFHFYKGQDLDDQNASIISRYKNYSRTQANSPTPSMSPEPYTTAATNYPDSEDINKDQTMSTVESYFKYHIPVSKSGLTLDNEFIIDIREKQVTLKNGATQTVHWYQFRIPVASGTPVNDITNFHSIRFMRLVLTHFKMPVVLRFSEFEMVRGEWRRYKFSLEDGNEPLEDLNNFESGVVNIEENDGRQPIPYVLPPGVEREQLQGTVTVQQQNEQSLSLKVSELEPEEARTLFKNVSFDLRMFKKLQMFIHAESKFGEAAVEDNELVAVIRIGSDLSDNFYQIEKPLKITSFGTSTRQGVWPEENNLNVDLEVLKKLKLERFEAHDPNNADAPYPLNQLYPAVIPGESAEYRLRVKGHPNLGNIKTIMLGVKNKAATTKSAEIWFNELRVSDFDNEGGYAAVISADANMADLMNISVTGRMSTKGYGNVDQSVNERSQEDVKQYDAVSNVNVGKLMPKNWGIQLPVSVSYGEEIKDPKYDAQYQDILLEDTNDSNSKHRNDAQDYTRRKSISLINVKKNRNPKSTKKMRFYDIENLSVSYAYNELYHHDYNVENFLDQNVRASAGYNYSFKPFEIRPFSKSKKLKNKYFKLIKDFNFNLLPNNITINSNIIRTYNEQLSRTLVEGFTSLPTLTQRNYLFDWDYGIAYKPTKSIRLNFRATNNNAYEEANKEDLDLYQNFFNLGNPRHYHQNLDASYQIPIDKIPLFSFIKSNYSYKADFDWQGASKDYVDDIGNTVQNANTHNLSVDLSMKKFYKEIGLPKLLRSSKSRKKAKRLKKERQAKREKLKAKMQAKKDGKKAGENSDEGIAESSDKQQDNTTESGGKKGEEQGGKKEGKSGRKNSKGGKFDDSTEGLSNNKKKSKNSGGITRIIYDLVTAVQTVKFSYQENNGTLLPGYTPQVGLLGRDNYSGGYAPSFGFVFGSQVDIRNRALENGWLLTRHIDDPYYNKIYNRTHYDKLDVTAKVSPFKNFDIDVSANKIYTQNIAEQMDPLVDANGVRSFAPTITSETGNFSMSYFMLGTAFDDIDDLFSQFKKNRSTIAQRLANDTGYDISGYGVTSQQVVLPAFMAAYSGQTADKVNMSAFRSIPLPNWQIRYRGLMKLKWFKKRFKSFSISHAYHASYSILNYSNNLQYSDDNPTAVDLTGNYFNKKLFTNVGLIDEFSPLVKVEMKLKNSFSLSGRINMDRMMTINFNNNTMTQDTGKEYVIGLGYRLKDVPFRMRIKGKKMRFKGDLDMKLDVSLRDDRMEVRYFGEDDDFMNDQSTGGQRTFNFKFITDYALTKNLQAGFYYIQDATTYRVKTSYDRRSINSGISFKYNLGN